MFINVHCPYSKIKHLLLLLLVLTVPAKIKVDIFCLRIEAGGKTFNNPTCIKIIVSVITNLFWFFELECTFPEHLGFRENAQIKTKIIAVDCYATGKRLQYRCLSTGADRVKHTRVNGAKRYQIRISGFQLCKGYLLPLCK